MLIKTKATISTWKNWATLFDHADPRKVRPLWDDSHNPHHLFWYSRNEGARIWCYLHCISTMYIDYWVDIPIQCQTNSAFIDETKSLYHIGTVYGNMWKKCGTTLVGWKPKNPWDKPPICCAPDSPVEWWPSSGARWWHAKCQLSTLPPPNSAESCWESPVAPGESE